MVFLPLLNCVFPDGMWPEANLLTEKKILSSPPPTKNKRIELTLTALCIQSSFIKLPVNQMPIIQLMVFTHQLFPSKETPQVDQRPDSVPEH